MSEIRIADSVGRRLEEWDDDIDRSVNGTLFHCRSFLAYHGDRFRDRERLLLVLDGDSLLAQLPVAITDEPDGRHLRTPYGASYGGFAFQRNPSWGQACGIVEAFTAWCANEGVTRVTITPPIGACSPLPLDVLYFALLNGGFRSVNRDISSVVALDPDVAVEDAVASRTRRAARRAQREGVTVSPRGPIADFWSVVDATFERHGTPPTHTLDEFRWLAEALPDRIYADVAYHDGQPVAGLGYFVVNRLVTAAFYICQRPDRQQLNGLTLCILEGLERARRQGVRWFDLGTSTAQMHPRENIFHFKEQFASVGQFRETFEWVPGELV